MHTSLSRARNWALVVGIALLALVSWRHASDSTPSRTTEATRLDAEPTANEAPRPLTARGLRNEIALAKLFGYVRYFHPSDEAARADWEVLAIRGAREVEAAADDAALAEALLALFRPISPTLRIVIPGQKDEPPSDLSAPAAGANYIYWRHFGLGTGVTPGSVYRSERVGGTDSLRGSAGVPSPELPFRADLGDGLVAMVPLALYVDDRGTLPHAASGAMRAADAERSTWSAEEREVRMADVILAWNVFQHFFPYFDVAGTDWPAELPRFLERAATDMGERAFEETLQRLTAVLRDGHAGAYKFGPPGILPLQWAWVEGTLTITAVDPSAGLSIGDTVLTINGRSAADALAAREELISGATPQWVRYRALHELRTGPSGTTVELTIDSARDATTTALPVTLSYGPPGPAVAEGRPEKIVELEAGIFYVDVARISEIDFAIALSRLASARGIVFDFRGYPSLPPAFLGHFTQGPLKSAQAHVPSVTLPDRQNFTFIRTEEWEVAPAAPFLAAKKAFIVDGRAISYAETCLSIVERYELGDIVGAPSAGTNGNATTFSLPGGYTVAWTGMKWLKHDGSRHHGVGVQPTIPVSRTRAGIAAGHDELLEAAVLAVKN